jgi:hypothetical protein
MSETLRMMLKGVVDRLQLQATTQLPSLIAAAIVLLCAFLAALVVRWVLSRIFKGAGMDRFMRQTGVSRMIDPSGQLRATRVVAEAAFWSILIVGILAGLSVFDTDITAQLTQSFVFLIPKLVIAGLIMLSGVWLSQYLARCMVVWAFNENLPYPRRLAAGVRVGVLFVAVVVAADHLNFARSVFLTAFIIFVGGVVLAVTLAVGIGTSGRVQRYLERPRELVEDDKEASLWTHL